MLIAAKSDQSVKINVPEKIPKISEIKTCFVVRASKIAITGGKILQIPYSILSLLFLFKKYLKIITAYYYTIK
jgi:hypothetical protein